MVRHGHTHTINIATFIYYLRLIIYQLRTDSSHQLLVFSSQVIMFPPMNMCTNVSLVVMNVQTCSDMFTIVIV